MKSIMMTFYNFTPPTAHSQNYGLFFLIFTNQ